MAKKKKMKLKKGPVLVLILLIIVLISFVFYYYTHTSKYLFVKGINKTYDNVISNYETFIDNYFPYINDNYHNKTNTLVEIKTDDLEESLTLKGDIYLTDKDNYFDLSIDDNTLEYKLKLLSRDNNLYYKIDNSSFYKTPIEYGNYDDSLKKLLSILMDSVKNNMSSSSFTKSDEDIEINGDKYNTKKITLNIKSSDYMKIVISFYEKLKNDDDLLNYFMYINDYQTKEELTNYIDSTIDIYKAKLKEKTEDESVCKYSIYFYRSKPVMNELSFDEYKISYVDYKDFLEVKYIEGDEYTSYMRVYEKKIDMFIDGIGYGKGKYDDTSFSIDFTDYDKKSLGHINYSYKSFKSKFDVLFDLDGFAITIESDNSINVSDEIPNVDISNSVSEKNITSSDREKLNNALSILNDIFAF